LILIKIFKLVLIINYNATVSGQPTDADNDKEEGIINDLKE